MKKVICFYSGYTGDSFHGLNYQKKNIYGSEINLIHLAENLSSQYTIYVLVWNLKKNDQELVYHNIHYIDCNNYELIKDKIDVLIINRYINFFIHLPNNAKKTIVWIQDLIAHYSYKNTHLDQKGKYFLLNIDNSIDKYITLTNFHKKYFQTFYDHKIKDHKIKIIGNGLLQKKPIPFQLLNEKRKKKRFLFCSEPVRGLTHFLNFIQKLQENEDEISVAIFRSNNYDEEIIEKIKNIKNITVYNTSSQEILFQEFLTCEFLLYTCTFLETFCNIAMEAQYHGCICIYNSFGALNETISDRGLILEGFPKDECFIEKNINTIRMFIKNEQEKNRLQLMAYEYANRQYYSDIASQWIEMIENL